MEPPALGMSEPLDFDSDVPVYEQIGTRIKFAIARGAYGPNAQLPSVRALARSLLVNPNTVIRVYRELERDGLVYTQRGRGVFVAPHAARRCKKGRTALIEERLGEAVALARQAGLDDTTLEALWQRTLQAGS